MKERYIVHLDMDAFFAAIEQRGNPQFQNKSVIVGADPKGGKGRGVVSTCSYEARKYGIHSAMPISIAYRRCPHGIFLPVDMKKYEKVSARVFQILSMYTPHIEPVSIDEAFLDITESFHLFGSPQKLCIQLKEQIKKETGLTASVGLAPTKMAAKIASDLKKPDGFVEVSREKLLDFLRPLPICRLWGVGQKAEVVLHTMGIKTIGDIAKRDASKLASVLGANGAHLWELAHGWDESEVTPFEEPKSISCEHTFERDTSDVKEIESALMALCERVSRRLRREGRKGRTITLKIRLEGFRTYTRAITISESTNFVDVIFKRINNLVTHFDTQNRKVRLLGVKVSHFSSGEIQYDLFKEEETRKRERIHKAVDSLQGKFGEGIIFRASSKKTK